uniref:Variant surface glycoprotein n=1 Tax=Trypanosoma brucei TaxID=5691 RepID=A0A1V0FZ46_9TRYP|nr:variant surface glycoprotein [Trypanosoma brucei]
MAIDEKATLQRISNRVAATTAAEKASAVIAARINYLSRVQGVVMAHPATIPASATTSVTANSAPCEIKISPAATTGPSCTATAKESAAADTIRQLLRTATHITLLDELDADKHVEERILNFKVGGGASWTTASDGNGQVCKTDSTAQQSFKLQPGKQPKNKAQAPQASIHKLEDASNKDATATENDYPAAELTGKQIAKVLHELQVTLNKPELDLATLTIEALKSDSQIAELARNLLSDNPGTSKLSDAPKGELLTRLLNRYFGDKGEAYNKRFLKELRSSELTVKLGDAAEAKPISFLCQPETFAKAITYLQGQILKKQTEKAIVTIYKTSEAICNDKKKDECSKENKCKWEGTEDKGTCKPKDEEDEVKAENDGKTTNTKGSNSFLIKASPLWLAFFLF